jgi:CxxC motif-containing protein (DUF1111 family)
METRSLKLRAPLNKAASRLLVVFAVGALAAQTLTAPLTKPGDPLPGLKPADVTLFQDGRTDFLEVEDAADGLGPAFNASSCAVCHNVPAVGGMGHVTELRVAFQRSQFDTRLTGAELVHLFSTPNHQCQPQIPSNAAEFARRLPIPLFGSGLVELIPDSVLQALADPGDRNGDGVTGRAAMITDVATGQTRVGRFGWKAQQATLLAFSGDAYRNEMGITNDLFPDEYAYGFTAAQLAACDPVTDPEDHRDPVTNLRGIDNFTNFMRFLAPIGRGSVSDTARHGEDLFKSIGCATCHVPVLVTGPSPIDALNRKPVPAYSDFLLHDVGTGDGMAQAAATGDEMRTPALWGLRLRRPLLHDGRALNPLEAIHAHSREGTNARQRFDRLSSSEQNAVLEFLKTL